MLKEKRCGTLKAIACADRLKQRKYITKKVIDSSTIQTISLMISLIIDVEEGRDVATVDVVVSIKNYIYTRFDIFALFEEKISKEVSTTIKNNLLKIIKNSKRLGKNQSKDFYHILHKPLYVSKRARLDIDVAIFFLSSRVTYSIVEDWDKFRRLLHYLHGTINLERIIGIGK